MQMLSHALLVHHVALRRPDTLPATATVREVRGVFARSEKVHMALVVGDDDRLITTIVRGDLDSSLPGHLPAALLGTLNSRTVDRDQPAARLGEVMDAAGQRRLAVIDSDGRLVGLACRKRSGTGFCTDEGVAARRAR